MVPVASEEEAPGEEAPGEGITDEVVQDFLKEPVRTDHSAKIGGEDLRYEAEVGLMDVSVSYGPCEMGYVAYVREDTKGEADRPITFCFNGGPGVSSEWVHMGFLGPRILELDEAGRPLTLPPKIKDNENSILDVTDLVVIDPVGTGFSKACGESKDEDFWTYERDIESVGEFIRLYLARNARWGSPKYVAGESYGTVRAVGLCDYLNSKYGMGLNGLMLVSSIQDFSTDSDIETDLARVLSLPTYVADAWYHGRSSQEYLEKPLEEVMEEARAFAGGEYLSALFRGRSLPEEERTGHGGKAL